MTLHLFSNVFTFTDDNVHPMVEGVGAPRVLWITLKARTNGFTIVSNINTPESGGFRVTAGNSLDLPIVDMTYKTGMFSLDDLYWLNTTAGSNAVIEMIGMRDI